MRMYPHDAFAVGVTPLEVPGVESALADALADELIEITNLLSELAFDLASHPDTLRRHMASLQIVDRATQAQLAIADVLRSRAPAADRIAAVTLESLAHSLGERFALRQNMAGRPDLG